jgi:hypothetical protein
MAKQPATDTIEDEVNRLQRQVGELRKDVAHRNSAADMHELRSRLHRSALFRAIEMIREADGIPESHRTALLEALHADADRADRARPEEKDE